MTCDYALSLVQVYSFFLFDMLMPEIQCFNKGPWFVKSLVRAEGELTVIWIIHSEFDVKTVTLIVTWRAGLEKGAHVLILLVIFFLFIGGR